MDDIALIMQYIAKQFSAKKGKLFEDGFIEYLRIVAVSLLKFSLEICAISHIFRTQTLAEDPPSDFVRNFDKITRIMCDLGMVLSSKGQLRDEFIGKWFTDWLRCLKRISSQSKYSIFKSAHKKL